MDSLVLLHTCAHPLKSLAPISKPSGALEILQGSAGRRGRFLPEFPAGETAAASPTRISTGDAPEVPNERRQAAERPAAGRGPCSGRWCRPGEYWLNTVKRDQVFRIVDVEGNQAADTLVLQCGGHLGPLQRRRYHPRAGQCVLELRYAAAVDGGKRCWRTSSPIPWGATIRWAEPARRNRIPCGTRSTREPCIPAAIAGLLAVAQHDHLGLSKRDLSHNINFFMNVPVTPEGGLTFADGLSGPGQYVEMRAAMDIIVLISNCPAAQQPVQCLQSDAARGTHLGPGCSLRF